jgi:hypothetical protein
VIRIMPAVICRIANTLADVRRRRCRPDTYVGR